MKPGWIVVLESGTSALTMNEILLRAKIKVIATGILILRAKIVDAWIEA